MQMQFGTKNFPRMGPCSLEDEKRHKCISPPWPSSVAHPMGTCLSLSSLEKEQDKQVQLDALLSWTSKGLVHQRQHVSPLF